MASPLLILKLDTPYDARLVRGFFHIHGCILVAIAALGVVSFILAADRFLATALSYVIASGAVALLALVSGMDRLRRVMTPSDTGAMRQFRQLYSAALAFNFCDLLTLFWVMSHSTLITCKQTPPGCRLGQDADCRHLCSMF